MEEFDLIVIGSGPGGYVAAVRASQLGLKTACVEKDRLGGVCLNWGCIPTKALLKNAEILNNIKSASHFGMSVPSYEFDFEKVIKRSRSVADRLSKGIDILFKKNKITKFIGTAKLISQNEITVLTDSGSETISAKKILIATGGKSKSLPTLDFDSEKIISAKDAMLLTHVPKNLVVIGAGAIGVEFSYIYNVFGSKVTLIEMLPHVLPVEDDEVSDQVERSLKKQGIKILTNAKLQKINKNDDGLRLDIKTAKDGKHGSNLVYLHTKFSELLVDVETAKGIESIEAEKVLVAVGVQPNSSGLGLEEVGVNIDRGFIKVDSNYETNIKNIYAIGDVIGPPLLAHKASAEAVNCIEKIKGVTTNNVDYSSIPGCTFCNPQVGNVGLTEREAKEKGINYIVGKFPYSGNGKAVSAAETEGFVKLIFDKDTDILIGAHVVGHNAAELLGELTLAKANKLTAKEIINTIHSHPTLSELIMESAAIIHGEAIHF
jgi:dihydrolipoamide dehydrogenase